MEKKFSVARKMGALILEAFMSLISLHLASDGDALKNKTVVFRKELSKKFIVLMVKLVRLDLLTIDMVSGKH